MKKLYDAVQRFCARHPRFGIPNLMLYIVNKTLLSKCTERCQGAKQ